MSKKLSKNDLVASLAKGSQISEATAKSALDHLVNQIIENLAAYGEVTLSGFGTPITIRQKSKTAAILPDEGIESRVIPPAPAVEQRKLERRNFILNIEVLDISKNESIGDLGDITTEGLMVVSDEPLAENRSSDFKIELPEEAEEQMEIYFEAVSIRCQKTIHENIYITGFKIKSIDEENRRKIEYLIEEYAV